jgi:hypothetical protein
MKANEKAIPARPHPYSKTVIEAAVEKSIQDYRRDLIKGIDNIIDNLCSGATTFATGKERIECIFAGAGKLDLKKEVLVHLNARLKNAVDVLLLEEFLIACRDSAKISEELVEMLFKVGTAFAKSRRFELLDALIDADRHDMVGIIRGYTQLTCEEIADATRLNVFFKACRDKTKSTDDLIDLLLGQLSTEFARNHRVEILKVFLKTDRQEMVGVLRGYTQITVGEIAAASKFVSSSPARIANIKVLIEIADSKMKPISSRG